MAERTASGRTTRRRVAAALSIQWSPALGARVRRRVDDARARRRQRRRIAFIVLALMAAGGLSYAFSRPWRAWRESATPPPSEPTTSRPRAPRVVPAPQPPAIVEPPVPAAATPVLTTPPVLPAPKTLMPPASGKPRPATEETVESLFATADAARLGGRFRDAVVPLTTIVTRFPADSRAAVAAFQLGRIQDDDFDDPAAAAAAFSHALALDPHGPLAADAARRAHAALSRAQTGAVP